jgi:hypothetical protein
VDALQRAKEKSRPEYPCSACGEWLSIDLLLLGPSHEPRRTAATGSQVMRTSQGTGDSLDEQLRELSRSLQATFRADLDTAVQVLLSRADEQFVRHLNTLDDVAEQGPRLFTLAPADTNWNRPGWIKQRFVLTLYCEHSRLPVPLLSDDPDAGVYELELPREWVKKVAPLAKIAAAMLSVALPAAKAIAQVELGEAAWKTLQAQVDGAHGSLSALTDSLSAGLDEAAQGVEGIEDLRIDYEQGRSGAQLRQLHQLLKERDITYAGLEKVRNNRRKPLWVHPRFVALYSPPPPVVPKPAPRSS